MVHMPSDTYIRVACTGEAECNTGFRAELVGIHSSLCAFEKAEHRYVLSDCASAIQAVEASLLRPHEKGYHHHRPLLQAICHGIADTDRRGWHTVIRKVRAHVGIEGNELAEWHAKFAAKNPLGTEEYHVKVHTLGAVPTRPSYWLFYDPAKPAAHDPGAEVLAALAEHPSQKLKSPDVGEAADTTVQKRPSPTPATDARPSASQKRQLEAVHQPPPPDVEPEPARYAFTDPQRQIRAKVRPQVLELTAATSL